MAEAKDQAEVAAQPEYVMEAIVDHRGNWNRVAEREFLVKWLGYEEEQNSWEAAADLNNDKAVQQYVREVNEKKKVQRRGEGSGGGIKVRVHRG